MSFPRATRANEKRAAFSLVELVVVIGIIGILMGFILPAVQRVRSTANRVECANNLRQMALALHNYNDCQGSLPPGCSYRDGRDPYPYMSWMTRILPFVEREALWTQAVAAYRSDSWFESPPHQPIISQVISTFICPADGRTRDPWDFAMFQVGLTSYQGVEGINQDTRDGVLFLDSRVRLTDIKDGTSNTLMVGERPPSADGTLGWWYAGWGQGKEGSADSVLGVGELNKYVPYLEFCPSGPYAYGPGRFNNDCDVFHYWSPHLGQGANFAFADGSVHFISYSAKPVMPALATRAGGEVVDIVY